MKLQPGAYFCRPIAVLGYLLDRKAVNNGFDLIDDLILKADEKTGKQNDNTEDNQNRDKVGIASFLV